MTVLKTRNEVEFLRISKTGWQHATTNVGGLQLRGVDPGGSADPTFHSAGSAQLLSDEYTLWLIVGIKLYCRHKQNRVCEDSERYGMCINERKTKSMIGTRWWWTGTQSTRSSGGECEGIHLSWKQNNLRQWLNSGDQKNNSAFGSSLQWLQYHPKGQKHHDWR